MIEMMTICHRPNYREHPPKMFFLYRSLPVFVIRFALLSYDMLSCEIVHLNTEIKITEITFNLGFSFTRLISKNMFVKGELNDISKKFVYKLEFYVIELPVVYMVYR